MSSVTLTAFLKWSVVSLLVLALAGGVALFYPGAVDRYGVSCKKVGQITCQIEQERVGSRQSQQVLLGTSAAATVEVRPQRRGDPRVLLYLTTATQRVFAAEFEGGDAVSAAHAAAARLNQAFSSSGTADVQVESRAPGHLRWGSAFMFALFVLFSLAIFRQLFGAERQPVKSLERPPDGAA